MLPIVALTVVVTFELVYAQKNAEERKQTEDSLEFSIEFGNLIHNIQRERDWTALYLSSLTSETTVFLRYVLWGLGFKFNNGLASGHMVHLP